MDILRKNKQLQILASVFGSAAIGFLTYLFYKKFYVPFKTRIQEAESSFLTHLEALRRSTLINNVSYVLFLNLKTVLIKDSTILLNIRVRLCLRWTY
jgi:hypothetical protein